MGSSGDEPWGVRACMEGMGWRADEPWGLRACMEGMGWRADEPWGVRRPCRREGWVCSSPETSGLGAVDARRNTSGGRLASEMGVAAEWLVLAHKPMCAIVLASTISKVAWDWGV